MKKMLLTISWPCLHRMCSTDVYCSKQIRQYDQRKPLPIILALSGIGQKKTVDAAKICGGAENVVKTETQQTFVNGLLGFITLGIYTRFEARGVLLTHCMSCPSIWATLSALLINILLLLPVVFNSDQPLSEGEIIRFSGTRQSGRLHYPRRRQSSRTD